MTNSVRYFMGYPLKPVDSEVWEFKGKVACGKIDFEVHFRQMESCVSAWTRGTIAVAVLGSIDC